MQIGYLGPLEIRDGGVPIELPGARLRTLLALLALEAGRPVAVPALIDALWPKESPGDPGNALQSLVSRLRRALGDPAWVAQVAAGYRLTVDLDDIDAVRFTRLAAQGRAQLTAGAVTTAAETLTAALALWRGEVLADEDSAAVLVERARLDEVRLAAYADCAVAQLAAGRPADVVAALTPIVPANPLREDLCGLLMRALVDVGRPAEALEVYERTRTFLAESLGSDPSPALQEQHLVVLRVQPAHATGRTNLRAAVTSFVGREEDVMRVNALLGGDPYANRADCRLVTIVGAGGAGKTRLASEVAAGWVSRAPDGVWFAELAPVTDPANIALAVLDGLGGRDVASFEQRGELVRREAREQILETLANADALLVVDNCEHVVEAAAHLIADILGACPRVRVIATSREPLAIDGETLFPLTPLGIPAVEASVDEVASAPAIRLLLDRARSVGAELSISADNAAAAAEVVRRLDGLPLAIELAAARLRVMPLAEVASKLADRFRLLTGGKRTAMPRHRTLRAVVEWSWELLTPREREVAEHFSVFGSGATAAAVAAVCPPMAGGPDPAELDDVLHALVDKSLLVSGAEEGEPRYRMLETLREFGSERLAQRGIATNAQARHAHYFAALVREADAALRTDQQLVALRRLDAERDDALTALAFLGEHEEPVTAIEMAVGLAWFWLLRENGKDAGRWLRFALALPGARNSDLYIVAEALHIVIAYAVAGDAVDVEFRKQQLISIAERLTASTSSHQLVPVLAPLLMFFAEDASAAKDLVNAGLAGSDPWVRAACRTVRVAFAENAGDLATMRADVDTAISEWAEIGDHWGAAGILTARGQLRTLDGDTAGAALDLEAALQHLRLLGGSGDDLMVNIRLADLRLRTGDFEGARRFAEVVRADDRLHELDAGRGVFADIMLGGIAAELGDEDDLRAVTGRLRARLQEAGEPMAFQAHATALAHAFLGCLAADRGDLVAARTHAEAAVRMGVKTNDLPILATSGVAAAAYANARGAHREAATLLGASAQLRGSPDHTDRSIARLTTALRTVLGADFDTAYDDGHRLDRDAATALLAPPLD